MLSDAAESMGAHVAPDAARFDLYGQYIRAEHGHLGRHNRRVVPICVRDYIRGLFPDPKGQFTGHRDASADDDF